MIRGFEPRLYQQTILGTSVQRNTMVVLPTGLGKTLVFLMLADYRLRCFPKSKILMLAPTKPLAQQHMTAAEAHLELPVKNMALMTGETAPEKREELWKVSNLIFSTPQTIENDILSGKVQLEDVSLLCFDECHRAVGDYSYGWIAKQYLAKARFPRVLGLTASPGSEIEKIEEVCKNLGIEDIEVRTYEDNDVKPYVKEIAMEMQEVTLPERFKQVKGYLETCFKRKIDVVSELLGEQAKLNFRVSKKEILELQHALHASLTSDPDPRVLKAISVVAEALKVHHALELLETQGSFALHSYLTRISEESKTSKVKAVKNLVEDPDFKASLYLTEQLIQEGIEHPKFERLIKIIDTETQANQMVKIIVFNHYRDSAKRLEGALNQLPHTKAKLFVGQAKHDGTGMSQKVQKEILDQFRNSEFNVLISTSIGEEGLDIPRVDLVVFYEPVPSAIRSIQRRGRTGRQEQGRVIVLVTKDTRDVAYRYSSQRKERRMYYLLKEIKQRLGDTKPAVQVDNSQSALTGFMKSEGSIRLLVDAREQGSPVLKHLNELGASIEMKRIESADYICSKDVAVELKSGQDFVDSIIDRRLLVQAKRMREAFAKPVIIIEEGPESSRMINKNAVYGALTSLALGFQIPVLSTKNSRETAELIFTMAKSEQQPGSNELSLHFNKPQTLKEQQEYLVSALPGIGPKLAKPLLKKFGSVNRIFSASEEELKEVSLIGDKKSSSIRRVLDGNYEE